MITVVVKLAGRSFPVYGSMVRNVLRFLATGLLACSGNAPSDAECDAVANEIRQKAIERGYDGNGDGRPDAIGVCTSPNPAIQRDFAKACEKVRACEGR